MSHTKQYFDRYKPRYSEGRIAPVLAYLKGKKDFTILELGCGDAVNLKKISTVTKNVRFFGIEESEGYRKLWPFRSDDFFVRSVLEDNLEPKINQKFDFILIAYLFHHLIGRSRSQSMQNVDKCLKSAKSMLKKGGTILILEPIFEPSSLMTALFYVKKFFSLFSKNRIKVFGYWNNIGAPIVSYLSEKQLKEIIEINDLKIVEEGQKTGPSGLLIRLITTKRSDYFAVLR